MSPGVQEKPKPPSFTPTSETPPPVKPALHYFNMPVAVFPCIQIPANPKELLRRTSGPYGRSESVEQREFSPQKQTEKKSVNGSVVDNNSNICEKVVPSIKVDNKVNDASDKNVKSVESKKEVVEEVKREIPRISSPKESVPEFKNVDVQEEDRNLLKIENSVSENISEATTDSFEYENKDDTQSAEPFAEDNKSTEDDDDEEEEFIEYEILRQPIKAAEPVKETINENKLPEILKCEEKIIDKRASVDKEEKVISNEQIPVIEKQIERNLKESSPFIAKPVDNIFRQQSPFMEKLLGRASKEKELVEKEQRQQSPFIEKIFGRTSKESSPFVEKIRDNNVRQQSPFMEKIFGRTSKESSPLAEKIKENRVRQKSPFVEKVAENIVKQHSPFSEKIIGNNIRQQSPSVEKDKENNLRQQSPFVEKLLGKATKESSSIIEKSSDKIFGQNSSFLEKLSQPDSKDKISALEKSVEKMIEEQNILDNNCADELNGNQLEEEKANLFTPTENNNIEKPLKKSIDDPKIYMTETVLRQKQVDRNFIEERTPSPYRKSLEIIKGLSDDLDKLPSLDMCPKRFSFLSESPVFDEPKKEEDVFSILTGIPPKISLIDRIDTKQKEESMKEPPKIEILPPWKSEQNDQKEGNKPFEPAWKKVSKLKEDFRAPSPFKPNTNDFWKKDLWSNRDSTPSPIKAFLKDDTEPAWKKELRDIAIQKAETKEDDIVCKANAEPPWRRELRELSQARGAKVLPIKEINLEEVIEPTWKPNGNQYRPMGFQEKPKMSPPPPTWSQTLRPKSWKERSAELSSQSSLPDVPEWKKLLSPKQNTTDSAKSPLDRLSTINSEVRKTPEITVEVVNQPPFKSATLPPNGYVYPWESSSDSSAAFSPEPRTPTPQSRNSPFTHGGPQNPMYSYMTAIPRYYKTITH